MSQVSKIIFVLWLSMMLAGCGGEEAAETACVPGQSAACACEDGSSGAQQCLGDGSGFQACVCADQSNILADENEALGGGDEQGSNGTSTENGESEPQTETGLLTACEDLCEHEFGLCASGAPEGWYEYEYPEDDWAQDLDSCKASCEDRVVWMTEKGQECIDKIILGSACVTALNCEEFWEYKFDSEHAGHCTDTIPACNSSNAAAETE